MSYRCKHKRNGFVGYGVECVGEYDAIARAVVEPDDIDGLLDNAVAVR